MLKRYILLHDYVLVILTFFLMDIWYMLDIILDVPYLVFHFSSNQFCREVVLVILLDIEFKKHDVTCLATHSRMEKRGWGFVFAPGISNIYSGQGLIGHKDLVLVLRTPPSGGIHRSLAWVTMECSCDMVLCSMRKGQGQSGGSWEVKESLFWPWMARQSYTEALGKEPRPLT